MIEIKIKIEKQKLESGHFLFKIKKKPPKTDILCSILIRKPPEKNSNWTGLHFDIKIFLWHQSELDKLIWNLSENVKCRNGNIL